jgi:hypothetical protein
VNPTVTTVVVDSGTAEESVSEEAEGAGSVEPIEDEAASSEPEPVEEESDTDAELDNAVV